MEKELEHTTNEFKTRDMLLASCLIVEGVKYLRKESDAENSRRLIFVFEQHPDIARIQSERANGTHVVSSTNYDDATRRMKTIVHGG